MTKKRTVISNEQGFSMFATLLLLLLTLTLGSATLMSTFLDVKATNHYKTGVKALVAAESGLHDALNTINHDKVSDLVVDAGNRGWDDADGLWDVTPFLNDPDTGYWTGIVPSNADEGWLFSLGLAPAEATRLLKARIRVKPEVTGFGAIFLTNPSGSTSASVNGSAFIDGHDYLLDTPQVLGANAPGVLNPDGPVVPGISTQDDQITDSVVAAVQNPANVDGSGPSPSVRTNGISTSSIDQMKQEILALGAPGGSYYPPYCCGPYCPNPSNRCNPPPGTRFVEWNTGTNMNQCGCTPSTCPPGVSPDEIGCPPNEPVIMHFTGTTMHLNAQCRICGMVIADDAIDMNGGAQIDGMFLSTNPGGVNINGSYSVRGTLWTASIDVDIGGNVNAYYSSAGVDMANAAVKNLLRSNMPKLMETVSWEEVPMDDPDLSPGFSLPTGLP